MADAFVDTSFVVALVNKKDQNHSFASGLAERFAGPGIVTTDAILLEIGNALSRNFKRESVEIIEHFLTSDDVKVIHIHPPLFRKAFDLYKSHFDKQWGLIDCVSFVVMKELAIIDALTADKHFEQAGFNVLIKT
ncbi:MAG: type II toxin-antitoxin system VapC family toxin [Pyrinomonadaceae bacterium]|nr:type II toxin-antitoxin system VapC family toxin [Pyrinomonadaceae bacterium]